MVSILCCKGIVIIVLGFVGILLLLVVILGLEAKSCNVAWFATIVACFGFFASRCGASFSLHWHHRHWHKLAPPKSTNPALVHLQTSNGLQNLKAPPKFQKHFQQCKLAPQTHIHLQDLSQCTQAIKPLIMQLACVAHNLLGLKERLCGIRTITSTYNTQVCEQCLEWDVQLPSNLALYSLPFTATLTNNMG